MLSFEKFSRDLGCHLRYPVYHGGPDGCGFRHWYCSSACWPHHRPCGRHQCRRAAETLGRCPIGPRTFSRWQCSAEKRSAFSKRLLLAKTLDICPVVSHFVLNRIWDLGWFWAGFGPVGNTEKVRKPFFAWKFKYKFEIGYKTSTKRNSTSKCDVGM